MRPVLFHALKLDTLLIYFFNQYFSYILSQASSHRKDKKTPL